MESTDTKMLPILPDDNLLGVVGRFQKNPPEVFRQMEKLGNPLVQFRLAHKKPVYVSSPEVLAEITRHWKLYQKGSTDLTKTLLGNGLVFSEEETWSTQRKILSPAFHRSAIKSYVDIMRGRALGKIEQLKEASQAGMSVDMAKTFHEIAIEIVRDCLFGTHNAPEQLAVVLKGTLFLLKHVVKIRKNPLMPPLWVPTPSHLRAKQYHKEIEAVVLHAIEEKRKTVEKGHTMLELMLWGRDEDTDASLSYQDIIDQVKIFFVAGTDTSANTLAWGFYLLGKHPEVFAKLRQEIQTQIGDKPVSFEDIPNLTYQKNVVNEVLRLYPPTWINSRKPTEDVTLAGYTISKGTGLVFSPLMMQRNPEYWEAPNEFRPERFAQMETLPPSFTPFLAGPRKCIGDQFALTEIMVVLTTIIQHFHWEFPASFEMPPAYDATLGMAKPLTTTLKPA